MCSVPSVCSRIRPTARGPSSRRSALTIFACCSFARTRTQIYGWGHSGWGQHGTGSTDDVLRPGAVPLPGHAAATALYGGRYHCFASTAPAAR